MKSRHGATFEEGLEHAKLALEKAARQKDKYFVLLSAKGNDEVGMVSFGLSEDNVRQLLFDLLAQMLDTKIEGVNHVKH